MDQKNHNGHSGLPTQGQSQNINKINENKPISRGVFFVIRKSEKLTTALYMVTDIMSEKDPMKWKLREIGVDILSDITLSANTSASERMSVFRNVMRKIERIVSFLDIAQSSQMMSEMNASVLKKEYLALKDAIEAEWHHVYDDGKRLLSRSFVVENTEVRSDVDTPVTVSRETSVVPNISEKETVPSAAPSATPKESIPSAQKEEVQTPIASPPMPQPKEEQIIRPAPFRFSEPRVHSERLHTVVPQDVHSSVPARPTLDRPRPRVSDIRNTTDFGSGRARSEGDRDDRRKIILALIKQKPSLTVKDISKSIPQVSEKTIQRELLAMVSEGLLLKKGERRWSTYSLMGM